MTLEAETSNVGKPKMYIKIPIYKDDGKEINSLFHPTVNS